MPALSSLLCTPGLSSRRCCGWQWHIDVECRCVVVVVGCWWSSSCLSPWCGDADKERNHEHTFVRPASRLIVVVVGKGTSTWSCLVTVVVGCWR